MLIESKIKRPNGSTVTMEGESYHFAPRHGTSAHVCDVLNRHHASRFLSITEGFRLYETDLPAEAKKAPTHAAPTPVSADDAQALADVGDDFGSDLADATTGYDAETGESGDGLDGADTGETEADAPEETEDAADGSADADAADVEGEGKPQSTAEYVNALSEDDLRAEYAVKNGRAAPVNAKPETLRTRLIELIDAA